MNTVEKYNHLIKVIVVPFLKRNGFSRKGNKFWRKIGDKCDYIDFQKSSYNTKDSCTFFVNIGVNWHELRKILNSPITVPPRTCTVFGRLQVDGIGPMQGQIDWVIEEHGNYEKLCSDLLYRLEHAYFPWLEKNKNIDELESFFKLVKAEVGLQALNKLRANNQFTDSQG